MTEAEVRAGLETLMGATIADEAAHHDWTYWAMRPRPVPNSWHAGQHVTGDCSKGCQFLCRWGGSADPMGMHFGPYGNSTTIWAHLTYIPLSEAKVGDIVTFGVNGSKHAAMIRRLIKRSGRTVDAELWSFGHQGAPNHYLLSQDGRSWTVHRLRFKATTARTAESVLKAETGYTAWMHWRLGSGAWHGWGRKNRKVRPNVRRMPPARWWKQLAAYVIRHRRPRRANPPTTEPATE